MRSTIPVLAVWVALSACGDPSARWEVGGIYSVSDGGEFRVAKVLAIDPGAVSLKIYGDSYTMRPGAVDPEALSMAPGDDPEAIGIGHVPLQHRDFALSFPVQLASQEVTEDELLGYRYWQESGTGAIDFDAMPEETYEGEVE